MTDTLSEWHQSLPCSVEGREGGREGDIGEKREGKSDREGEGRERKIEGEREEGKQEIEQRIGSRENWLRSSAVLHTITHDISPYLSSRNNHAVCNL